MDFDFATKRLQRDQQSYQQRTNHKKQSLTLNQNAQIQRNKLQQQRILQERQRKVEQQKQLEAYIEGWDHRLNLKSLSASPKQHLELTATSIYGDGDKITLAPSVLERLMDGMLQPSKEEAQPWTFRIGIVNPNYVFPSSSVLQSLPLLNKDDTDNLDDDEDEVDAEEALNANAYLDELRHKYVSYTHGTVIEFTQDEGFVGIPESIANVLLHPSADSAAMVVPRTRTVDAASVHHTVETTEAMDRTVDSHNGIYMEDEDAEKTPGHLAWGAFDIPSLPIELSMVRLPKGKSVTLQPTISAIQMGFYLLKDIKFVLEQSLMRTRATLTVGDTIHTWHRGKKFDLTVQRVTPSTFDAILCIDTDLEIEFDAVECSEENVTPSAIPPLSSGRRLNEAAAIATMTPVLSTATVLNKERFLSQLRPEPPIDQQENVITIQFRYRDRKDQRRYDIQEATIQDVLDFVRVAFGDDESVTNTNHTIQLVQRYPRRVYTWQERSITLSNAGMAAGSEVLFVETI
jgi:hypothetical protein